MNFKIRYKTISSMLELCKKLKWGNVEKKEIEDLIEHEDYKFEFERYKGKISKEEFTEYFINLPNIKEEEITNKGLKIHHKFYKDLLDNLDFYMEKVSELDKFTEELFEQQISIALKGLPEDINLSELNFIFTVGIGQSFGYVYKNGMHFDFLQLVKEKSIDDFCATIAHEVHHVALNTIYEELDLNNMPIEDLFYLSFSGEGLAVKYCNNAEGVLSKSIYDGPKNIGLDKFTWEYLNKDFYNTMKQFKASINYIRAGHINTMEELVKYMEDYWMNPYVEGQDKNKDIPKLKQFRVYSFGNEIWGIIHDCFGKEMVYKTIRNPQSFRETFNKALEKLSHEEFKI
ncbi:DUF5700 domain-containing putative Zn-dependent protease [Haloimpatiens massiliensis]|uniref:DUF5700 domain-containing putative Zn-dependent protease n=1 Tax=Haloimpatiens massiliensis TaxID=1658110 RepID=UPI000C85CD26|nr:DUF5700 domain-containing putative Zn-dependent protease [Haloimpatiens massiliensis]